MNAASLKHPRQYPANKGLIALPRSNERGLIEPRHRRRGVRDGVLPSASEWTRPHCSARRVSASTKITPFRVRMNAASLKHLLFDVAATNAHLPRSNERGLIEARRSARR